jgi:hypothetical protein
VTDPALEARLRKAVRSKKDEYDRGVFLDPSPDGKYAWVFHSQSDVSGGHGYWSAQFTLVDDKQRLVQQFGYGSWLSPGSGGTSAWSDDSAYAAVYLASAILFWRAAQRKFAAIRVLGGDVSLSWKGDAARIKGFSYVYPQRGRGQLGQSKTGKAVIRMDQLGWYPASDHISAMYAILESQPHLTPELFED